MSEVFSIQISKHGADRHIWLDLPATAEQVRAAMGQIGVTQDNPWDYFISGFSSPEGRHLAIPYDLVLASGVNELNFLAARLEKLDAYEIGTLNAALQQKNTELRTISRIIDYPDNLDYFVNLPDIHTVAALGDYYLNRSGIEPFPKKRTQKVKKKWNDSRGIRYRWLCSGAEKIILKTRGRNPTQSRVRAEGVVEDFQIGKDIALRRRSGWIVF